MTASELYDATRASWKVGEKRRQQAKYAFAVFEGIVREVYEIKSWLKAGSTFNSLYPSSQPADRWEFVGRLAPDHLRRHYINRDVSRYFKQGARNPIGDVNIQ
jgi:hypothetical protein